MLYASSRLLYGGVQHNPPSRFLSEIDSDFQAAATESTYGYSDEPTYDISPQHSQAASNEPRYVPELQEGDGVEHQLFGKGTVVELDGDTATIYFRGKGTRKLNIAFAPLKKL